MPHPTKKQRLDCHQRDDDAVDDDDFVACFDDLSDVLPNILGFLALQEIMCSRRVNKKSMEAVKKAIVPPTDFCVNSLGKYSAINEMTRAVPNLQQIRIGYLEGSHKWSDGEDPNEELAATTADYTTHDIEIISNFRKLRNLIIDNAYSQFNGRYPFLFNRFPLLQTLNINYCFYLKFDLEMLAGFPLLKELKCEHSGYLSGHISSLRVLKDTLEKVHIRICENVEGNFMDLADFPRLMELDLGWTAVTGDIRDIGESDFSSLEELDLPKGVYGGNGHELQRISDAPDLINLVYLFNKQRPALKIQFWFGKLSEDSPDWYEPVEEDGDTPPFKIIFVKAGPRIGYRWTTSFGNPCEVNWLDPEPDRESSDYAQYIEELSKYSQVGMFKGFHQPPTEEEFNRLWEEYMDNLRNELPRSRAR